MVTAKAKHLYRVFLERLLTRLFVNPGIAFRSIYNSRETRASHVIPGYLQGIYLLGTGHNGGLEWQYSDVRSMITANSARVEKSLQQFIRGSRFQLEEDRHFREVVEACRRPDWTWINDEIIQIYSELHHAGFARSIEVSKNGELVGGLWGVEVLGGFVIMSMFHSANRAGSVAVAHLVQELQRGRYSLIDCGAPNRNFERFGAVNVPTSVLLDTLLLPPHGRS